MAAVKYSAAAREKKHRTTPYSYRPGNTALHRLNPALKLLALLVITTAVFLFGFYALAGAAAFLTICARIARIRPRELLRGIKPVLIMSLAVIVSRSVVFESPWFSLSGCGAGLLFSGNMVICFTAGALLFSVTTMTELKDSLEKIERLILKAPVFLLRCSGRPALARAASKMERPNLSLAIPLMLGFLPRFFEIWEAARTAYTARSGKKGIRAVLVLVPLVTGRMIETAMETAQAMESRGASLRF
ncbi:MAG: energy-coupling factor transporter transmembrane protein EcfT [Treponema sp.]|jgi:biotin transport system permease protein|nr:energy-coupling factor transporter transmembrane protein EcfT [Treponema sp.]